MEDETTTRRFEGPDGDHPVTASGGADLTGLAYWDDDQAGHTVPADRHGDRAGQTGHDGDTGAAADSDAAADGHPDIRADVDSHAAPRARTGIGVCLSGGGYRAALFHLGALRRLNELGVLAGVATVSAVSGGSITANLLADPDLRWPAPADHPVLDGFDERVAAPLRELTARNLRTPALLAKLLPTRWAMPDSGVRGLADRYARSVPWWARPLRDLTAHAGPLVVSGATDVAYGVDWTFDHPSAAHPRGRMGDYCIGYAEPPAELRVADAVAASCGVPPVFAPMTFSGTALGFTGGHRGRETPEQRAEILAGIALTDGGVYDNLGLEPVWKNHAAVLVSDGGAVFRARTERTLWGRNLRILDIATGGGTSTRVRWLHASLARGVFEGSSWSLRTTPPDGYPLDVVDLIEAVRTDLDAFSPQEQMVLERHGYLVADWQVHRHVPDVIRVDAPLAPPHEEVADPAVARRALADSARRTLFGRW